MAPWGNQIYFVGFMCTKFGTLPKNQTLKNVFDIFHVEMAHVTSKNMKCGLSRSKTSKLFYFFYIEEYQSRLTFFVTSFDFLIKLTMCQMWYT